MEFIERHGFPAFGGYGMFFSKGLLRLLDERVSCDLWDKYGGDWNDREFPWYEGRLFLMFGEADVNDLIYRGPWTQHPFGFPMQFPLAADCDIEEKFGSTWIMCGDDVSGLELESVSMHHLAGRFGAQIISTVLTLHKVMSPQHFQAAKKVFNYQNATTNDYLSLACAISKCPDCVAPVPRFENTSCSDVWKLRQPFIPPPLRWVSQVHYE